ncbi:hypothetical protein HUG17_1005 [Dermatophagoides farinae]|uniref:Uncharacterized protein n=1 Tax=Dermatophagoides farinae TaxID=6954 RepID=A0A9D4P7P5_DERFA|nr:uncharacterized protein LOC124492006 [Dermatophagoides farinae]KAH7645467.1 hypothetical protein HUG17_1005 [Dermatophagoides farinae]
MISISSSLSLLLFILFTSSSSLIQCRSIFSEQQEQFLSEIFPPEMVNVQQIAEMAMNPGAMSNHTLIDLFTQANDIVNSTGADSVLLEIDDHANKNNNNSIKVLAVAKPDVPSHEDLMKKFNLYFVNLTESPLSFINNNHHTETSKLIPYSHRTYWQIFVDFLRNQANAVIGAMMIPINVSMNAIQKSTQTHAEYVMAGSSLGSVISAPVILKSISIPNIISQHIVDVASNQVNNLETFNEQTKLMADNGIKTFANGLNNGTQIVSNVTSHYVIRPIGAFTGFNLNRTGHHINNIGQSFANTGLNIHLFGERVGSNAEKLVSAGATAIVWGLDNTVKF